MFGNLLNVQLSRARTIINSFLYLQNCEIILIGFFLLFCICKSENQKYPMGIIHAKKPFHDKE